MFNYFKDNKLCNRIRVADKSHWQTSQFNAAHTEAFSGFLEANVNFRQDDFLIFILDKALIQFVQCDLSKDAGIAKAFDGGDFDYVVNLCGI